MSASVTRLRPRLGSRNAALDAYRRADLAASLTELRTRGDDPSRLLFARALLRASRPADALAALEPLLGRPGTHAFLCERDLMHGLALARLGAFDAAFDVLIDARVYAISAASTPMLAEAEYDLGLLAFARGDVDGFAHAAQAILDLEVSAYEPESTYDVPLAHTRARAYEALFVIAAARGFAASEGAHARRALAELEAEPIQDLWIRSQAVVNLAVFARNADSAEAAAIVRAHYDAITWTPEIAHRRFAIHDALGWCAAMRGDEVSAFRSFRAAAETATADEERVIVAVDGASLAMALGRHDAAREELERAWSLAECIDWSASAGDRRLALCWLADALAPFDPVRARALIERFDAIDAGLPVLAASRVDPRTSLLVTYARARVAAAEGARETARAAFRTCFEMWTTVGYAPRAADASAQLAALGDG